MRTEGLKTGLLSAVVIASLILSVNHVAHAQEEPTTFSLSPSDFTVVDAPPLGEPYRLERMLVIRNGDTITRVFALSVLAPPPENLEPGYEPIPNESWIVLEPAFIEIEENSSDMVEIFLNIPGWENLTGRKWEAWISVKRMAEPGELIEVELISKAKIETTEERLPDASAPTVTITAPWPGISTDATSIILEATVTKDTWETYAEITVRIDATSLTAPITATNVLDAEGKLVRAVELVEGTNMITVSAQDVVGNWSTVQTVTVTCTLLTSLTISEENFTLQAGESKYLTATLISDGSPVADKLITWNATAGTIVPSSSKTNTAGQVSVVYIAPPYETDVIVSASYAGSEQYEPGSVNSYGTITEPSTGISMELAIGIPIVIGCAIVGAALYMRRRKPTEFQW